MAEQINQRVHFITRQNQPLIGIILGEKGREAVYYFAEEAEADDAVNQQAIHEILNLAGAWSDLDWNLVAEALDHIRHESGPTPRTSL